MVIIELFVPQVAAQESRKRKKEHMEVLEDKYVITLPCSQVLSLLCGMFIVCGIVKSGDGLVSL